eukprot:jgi/Tetstr1/421273/TSEL_001146.t1
MEVDNVAGNRNDLGSNGEEEPVPGGPVVAANAGAMGEPDRAGRLLDDNFWEDNELQEGEPAGFPSSLNRNDDDTTDEEPAEEEDEEQEGEQRQQPEVGNGTKDPDDDRELPECFSHELIGKPPKNSSIGGVLVDLLGVKADYELPTAAYEEILYILNTALGNDRRAVGDCTTAVRKNRKIILEPYGIYFDFGIIEILWRMLRRPDSAASQPYRHDLSKNAFLNSDFGRQLKEATDGAIADAANLIMDGIHLDGAVRFLGYFAAAAQTLWHQAFNPILPPGNGVRDTRARQEGEAQKRCITEVLRDPGRQCVQSCFAGADGSMLTDTELEALQRASTAGKLPKGLTASAHVHAAYDILGATFSIVNSHALPLHHAPLLGVVKTFLLRMGEVQVQSRGPGSAMIKFKNFYRIYDQRVKNIKADAAVYAKPGETEASLLGRILETDNAIDNRRLDGAANLIRFAKICEHLCGDFRLMCSNLHVLVCRYFRKVIVGKCSKDLERAFAVEVMKQRWENWGAGLVPVDFYIRQTTEQRKDLAFMPTGSAEAENRDMFQEILQVEVSYFVVAERHRKDNALAAPPVAFAVGDAHRGSHVTGLWEGPINIVFQQDFVFPPSIVYGRLVTYTWTEAISIAGRGRRQRAAADAAPRQMIRWCSYVKHSHAKDIAALDEDDGALHSPDRGVAYGFSESVTGLGSPVAQQAIAGTERQRSERAVPAALKHHFDAAFDALYPIDGVTGLPYLDAEIVEYTKGHIIKRFKELAATATGLAYDIIPGAPTDYVLRKQIQKAARSRRRNWPLSKKWPERKTQVIQLWAATWWGRYYTESVTKGTTAVPHPV